MSKQILLVGEQPAHGADPRVALYPTPPGGSGGRLARILGLSPDEYLERFDRVNLCELAWRDAEARQAAQLIKVTRQAGSGVVLLGRKAQRAFGWARPRYEVSLASYGLYALALPHPSGLCREWNDPRNAVLAREALAQLSEVTREVR